MTADFVSRWKEFLDNLGNECTAGPCQMYKHELVSNQHLFPPLFRLEKTEEISFQPAQAHRETLLQSMVSVVSLPPPALTFVANDIFPTYRENPPSWPSVADISETTRQTSLDAKFSSQFHSRPVAK